MTLVMVCLSWAGRQGGCCDTALDERRDHLGCVPCVASGGIGRKGTISFTKYFRQPLSSFWFLISDFFDMVHFKSLY